MYVIGDVVIYKNKLGIVTALHSGCTYSVFTGTELLDIIAKEDDLTCLCYASAYTVEILQDELPACIVVKFGDKRACSTCKNTTANNILDILYKTILMAVKSACPFQPNEKFYFVTWSEDTMDWTIRYATFDWSFIRYWRKGNAFKSEEEATNFIQELTRE